MQLQSEDVRFLFEGERLSETTTSEDLNMQNGADINAVIHQTGGWGFYWSEIICFLIFQRASYD